MRLWHYELLPYLPDLQFKGQLREIVAIMHDWRDKGKTNHILINRVMEYPKSNLQDYYFWYCYNYEKRYGKGTSLRLGQEFFDFDRNYPTNSCIEVVGMFHNEPIPAVTKLIFKDWHNKEYLRICMANLYEKHQYGIGKHRISDDEWQTLLDGYKEITGEDFIL